MLKSNLPETGLATSLALVFLRTLIAVSLGCGGIAEATAQAKLSIDSYECQFTEDAIEIDGEFEKAWKQAVPINSFSMPWLGNQNKAPDKATTAWMLWDREYLYVYATMIDADIYADIDQHDAKIWDNDVIELFLKPGLHKPAYYEFQVSALNTHFDAYFPERGDRDLAKYKYDHKIESMVTHDGTLNERTDNDKSWSAEIRIPWTSFMLTGGRPEPNDQWRFAVCRYDHRIDREKPELTSCASLDSLAYANFHSHEDYASLRFVPQKEAISTKPFGLNRFSPISESKVVGVPEPPLPYRVTKAYPQLKANFPIAAKLVPRSTDLLFVDGTFPYSPTKLRRMKDDREVTAYETLINNDSATVHYDICFHPDYHRNGYVYLGSNTKDKDGDRASQVTRYFLDPKPPYALDANSATTIIQWKSAGHNGAAIDFGPDGMMYVTSGDGTSDSDADNVGQRLDTLRSKVLRIDVNKPVDARMYSVPSDNPFVNAGDAKPETWAFGLRNPWRLTIDHRTGNVWVGNNGQDLWEQVYRIERGANYGWSVFEGSHAFYDQRELRSPVSKPIFEHPHSEAKSLTGGVVYYGKKYAELHGAYIYGDYSTGKIWAALHDGKQLIWHKPIADTQLAITGFAIDKQGEVLVLDHRGDDQGNFYHLELTPQTELRETFPKTLSETGLFHSVVRHEPHSSLIPYSVNSPQWSSGAGQTRFLGLPDADASIAVDDVASWEFPDRTVLFKTLWLETQVGTTASKRPIETQLLTKQDGDWAGYSYAWNNEGTEAFLVGPEGKDQMIEVMEGSEVRLQNWRFSSRTECMNCHSQAAGFAIGMNFLQLNRDHDYGDVTDNQLRTWEHLGILSVDWWERAKGLLSQSLINQGLTQADAEAELQTQIASNKSTQPVRSKLLSRSARNIERMPGHDEQNVTLDSQARSWLHGNCAHCHVSSGGGNALIDLHFRTDDAKLNLFDAKPVHATFGLPNGKLIERGEPYRSILFYRISTTGSGRMPQTGSDVIDQKSVDLIRRWIESMQPSSIGESNEQPSNITSTISKLGENLNDPQIVPAIEALLSTTNGALALTSAMARGEFSSNLQENIVSRAISSGHMPTRDLFERFVSPENRAERLGMTVNASDILRRAGNKDRGKVLFDEGTVANCKACHQSGDGPELLGPNLTDISGRLNRAEILESILNPSKKVDDKYRGFLIVTADGTLRTGRLLSQDEHMVVLRDSQNNDVRINRIEIDEMKLSPESMMPAALVQAMTADQLADLLAFLDSLQPTTIR